MLSQKFRLNKEKEINSVLRRGQKYYSRLFSAAFLPNTKENPRFCFIVSNKISKKATVRNRIKRLMRESVKQILLNIDKNYDIAISVRQKTNIAELGLPEISADLEWMLKRCG